MTDLIDRMRTCAAYLMATAAEMTDVGSPITTPDAVRDAADLLIEASNLLEAAAPAVPAPLTTPMEIIPPPPVTDRYRAAIDQINRATDQINRATDADLWIAPGGKLPGLTQSGTVSPRACPRCDSRAGKRVYRKKNHLMLACPVCGHNWEFKKTAGMTGG